MKKVAEVALIIALLSTLFYGFMYAFDNDPNFQLSKTYTGQ